MSKVSKLTPIQKRRQRGALTLLVLSIASLIGFGVLQKQSAPVTYKFVLEKEWIAINEWTLDSRTGSYGFSIVALLFRFGHSANSVEIRKSNYRVRSVASQS